jgi:hypothetical protein
VQTPPQFRSPGGQTTTGFLQTPAVQVASEAHAWPHEPQLAGSLERSTQVMAQSV